MKKIKRGFQTSKSLWLPEHYGGVIAKKGGFDKTIIWKIEDVMDFIFPGEFQPTQHKIVCGFMRLVLEKDKVDKEDIKKFAKKNNYSRSTIANRIIPKLIRFGLVKNANYPRRYLFKWDHVPGKGNERFLKFLEKNLKIEWTENAKIKKSDNNKIITVVKEKNLLRFKLNDEKNRVSLEINGKATHEYILKRENNGLNVYSSSDGRLIQGIDLRLTKSLAFANYLERIGFAWRLIVSEADKRKE